MSQKEVIERALSIIGDPDPEDALDSAIHEVLKATYDIKNWEAEEGDTTECECPQCVATTTLAHAILKIAQEEDPSD
jgi:hypothetical protein